MSIDKNERSLFILLVVSTLVMVLPNFDQLNVPSLIFPYLPAVFSIALVYLTRKRFLLFGVKNPSKEKLVLTFNVFKFSIGFLIITVAWTNLFFGIANVCYSQQSPIESHSIPVDHVTEGTSRSAPSIVVSFKGQYNHLKGPTKARQLKKLRHLRAVNVNLRCREGMLGSYVLESWDVDLPD